MLNSALLYYLFLSLLGAISIIFLGRKTIFQSIYKEVIFRGLFSLILIATLTAIYFTRCRTVFIVSIPILIYFVYYHKTSENAENKIKYNRIGFIVLGIISILSFLFSYLYLEGDVFSGLKIVSLDQSFYASLSDLMIFSKTESFNFISNPLNPSNKIVPYHYFENWLGIFLSKVFSINSVNSLYGIILPTAIFLSVLGIFTLIEPKSDNVIFVLLALIVSVFFLFITGFYYESHINAVFFEGNFKFIYVIPFFVFLIISLIDGTIFSALSYIVLLIIPVINIVFLPHVALLTFSIIMYNLYFYKGIKNLYANKFLLITSFIYIGLFTYYLFFLSKTTDSHSEQIITSVGGIYENVKVNVFSFLKSKFILLLIISCLFYIKKTDVQLKQLFIFSIFFLIFGSVSGAILNTNQNAYQIFLSADIMVTFVLFIILIRFSQLLNNKVNILVLSSVCILSIYCFTRDFVDKGKVTLFEDLNKYEPTFLRKLSSFKFENKIGIKLVDAEQRIYTRRNPVYCGASAYFPYLDNILYSIVVNPHTLLAPNDDQLININRNIEFINGSAFLKNNISEKFELDTFQYQEDIVTFIDKFKPEFCIVEGNISIPEYIKPFVLYETKLKSNNEHFYLLKYYNEK